MPGSLDTQERVLVRLFRLWVMTREEAGADLHRLHEVAGALGLPDHTASACDSFFQLVEHALARPLVRERCCAREFSADETALVSLVAAAPSLGQVRGTAHVPHGLPGAVYWAAMTVRGAIGWPTAAIARSYRGACPFENRERAAAC